METESLRKDIFFYYEDAYHWLVRGDDWDTLFVAKENAEWFFRVARTSDFWDTELHHKNIIPIEFDDLPEDMQLSIILSALNHE